jgi:hypothetical protein
MLEPNTAQAIAISLHECGRRARSGDACPLLPESDSYPPKCVRRAKISRSEQLLFFRRWCWPATAPLQIVRRGVVTFLATTAAGASSEQRCGSLCGRNSRAPSVSGVVDHEVVGMLVIQGGASLGEAGKGQGKRQNPMLGVVRPG